MTDLVELKVKGDPRSVKANRNDLVRESLYFKAMFSENFVEQGKRTIELVLKGVVSFEILTTIVKYTTSKTLHRIVPTKDSIKEIIVAADYFQMELLKGHLSQIISSFNCVDSSNAIPLWQLTIRQKSLSLQDALEEYIMSHFESVSCDISFVRLDVESVRKVLEWDQLEVTSEKQILAAIKMWINSAYDDRIQHFTRLVYCLRLDYAITTEFLKDNILNYCKCVGCTDFVLQYEVLQMNRKLVVGINTQPRLCFEQSDDMDYYDDSEDEDGMDAYDDDFGEEEEFGEEMEEEGEDFNENCSIQ